MRKLVYLLAFACCVGCVSARHQLLGETYFPPYPKYHPILIYESLADVERPFVKVAIIHAKGAHLASWSKVEAAMKDEARMLGADALVLRDEYSEPYAVDGYGNIYRRKRKTAVAIRWVTEEVKPPGEH